MKILQPHIAFGPNKETPKNSISEIYHENTKMHPQAAAGSDARVDRDDVILPIAIQVGEGKDRGTGTTLT